MNRGGTRRDNALSLRARLLRWLLVPMFAALVLMSGVSYYVALDVAEDDFDDTLLDAARELARQVKRGPAGITLDLPDVAREILEIDFDDRIFFRVVDDGGRTIAGQEELPLPRHVFDPGAAHYYNAAIQGVPVRVAGLRLTQRGEVPPVTILVGETLAKRNDLAWDLMVTVLAPELVLLVLMTLIVWFGVRRGLAPLTRVADSLDSRGWHDLSSISNLNVPAEARALTDALNDLMARLHTAQESQQRFIADAAHQLRTPLAGLLAQADRVLHERDVESMRPAMVQLQASARRIVRLANQLLLLARADAQRDLTAGFRPVDFAALVRQVCTERVPEALARGVDLGYAGEEGAVTIAGDDFLLREMVNNLIDNALQYGANPGRVTVRLQCAPLPVLSVEDTGPGVPESDVPYLFDRFYRTKDSPPGGSGLGLAIMREIAQAHGAGVSVDRLTAHGGAVFRVVFGAMIGAGTSSGAGVSAAPKAADAAAV